MAAEKLDPRIAAGMATQLAARRKRIAAGEKPIGWKVGFGAKPAMEKLGLDAPLVGYLMEKGLVASGSAVSLAGWTKPVAEPEVAVHIGAELPGDPDEAAVAAAIAGFSPAIELADLNPPPDDIETILGGNIFHRHVLLGEMDGARAGGSVEGLTTHVTRNGEPAASQKELEANTGRIGMIVAHVATVLAQCGERLSAGDFIIAGSITPPFFLDDTDRELVHDVDGLGRVSVRLTHG